MMRDFTITVRIMTRIDRALSPHLARAAATLIVAAVAACSTSPTAVSTPTPSTASIETRSVLAPGGTLRVAVYRGSPSSIVSEGNDPRGVGYDLGRALAVKLGVPFEPVVFPNNAAALAAIKHADADVIFTNASPARAKDMDFSPTFLDVGKSFLVRDDSPAKAVDDMKKPGLRVGVSAGSSTAEELAPLYPNVTLVPIGAIKDGVEAVRTGAVDAFATNKAILYEMSDALSGSRVLDGSWGTEHFAAGIPKGRERGRAFVATFVAGAQRDGTVTKAVERAGLRGTIAAAPPAPAKSEKVGRY
jgi:polar amino acid transport system substrate-binding protein